MSRNRGVRQTSTLSALAVFVDRRTLVMLALGFSAGLPFLLIFDTLSAWLRAAGLSLEVIGFFSLVTMIYSFKFLWAPLVDRTASAGAHGVARTSPFLDAGVPGADHARPLADRRHRSRQQPRPPWRSLRSSSAFRRPRRTSPSMPGASRRRTSRGRAPWRPPISGATASRRSWPAPCRCCWPTPTAGTFPTR